MTALLLTALLAVPAQTADVDPEPPAPGPITARLVAKKATYRLDFGGMKKEDYVKAARAGTATPVPVDLELVLTNRTKNDVRIRVAGTNSRLTLKLTGDGAIEAVPAGVGRAPKLSYQVLKPGEKVSIPITTLATREQATRAKARNDRAYYWTEPGDYTLAASFYTLVFLDYKVARTKSQYLTFTARPVTLKVEK